MAFLGLFEDVTAPSLFIVSDVLKEWCTAEDSKLLTSWTEKLLLVKTNNNVVAVNFNFFANTIPSFFFNF